MLTRRRVHKFQGYVGLFLSVCFLGCGPSTKQIMESWQGAHVSKLIRSWGPPNRVTSDGAGGRIYIWSTSMNIPLTEGHSRTRRTVTNYPNLNQYDVDISSTYQDRIHVPVKGARMFWVNEKGHIYWWKAKGLVSDKSTDAVLIGSIVVVGTVGLVLAYLEYKETSEFVDRFKAGR